MSVHPPDEFVEQRRRRARRRLPQAGERQGNHAIGAHHLPRMVDPGRADGVVALPVQALTDRKLPSVASVLSALLARLD